MLSKPAKLQGQGQTLQKGANEKAIQRWLDQILGSRQLALEERREWISIQCASGTRE